MIPEDVTHVLYHAECEDGFGAAWAAWLVLGDRGTYRPVTHGDPPPELPPEARLAIVDFSYSRDLILELKSRCTDIIVLDHHITAREELRGLDFAIFDLNRSGARLAWDYWHPGQPPPLLIEYVEDKDLWRFELPSSKEVSVALHSYPMDFGLWSALDVETLKMEGVALLRLQEQLVEAACRRARWGNINGYQVPIVNATEFRSEIANRLCEMYPRARFAAAYYDTQEGERAWSLRSIGEFDVAAVARHHGGGGHRNAAGYLER
ncbi:MAG: hypothetical protein HY319_29310 [Armatimonadetes bacterium]|nr:hypothetical protein [Armatimonadota bacterium]